MDAKVGIILIQIIIQLVINKCNFYPIFPININGFGMNESLFPVFAYKSFNIIQSCFGRNLQVNDLLIKRAAMSGFDVIKAERRCKTFAVAHCIVDINIDAVFVAISRLDTIPKLIRKFLCMRFLLFVATKQ